MTKVHQGKPTRAKAAKAKQPETISLVQSPDGSYHDKPILGRPPVVTPVWQEYICEQLRAGRSLLEMTTTDKPLGIPSYAAIQATLMRDPAFQENYARARSEQQEALAEQTIAIAKGIGDYAKMDVNERRLLIDTIKWSAGKLRAKVYGERMSVDVDQTTNIKVELEQKLNLDALDDDTLAQLHSSLGQLQIAQKKQEDA